MIAAYSSALYGMNAASNSLAERAGRLIQSSVQAPVKPELAPSPEVALTSELPGGDLSESAQADDQMVNDLVGLGLDKTAFKFNVAVLRSAREMEQRLLDIIT